MPGLIDTHIHAPQYSFTGTGYDCHVVDWLNKYTFPTEARFEDTNLALDVYKKLVVSFHKMALLCFLIKVSLRTTF